jgi:hypothetical protein
MTVQTQYAWPQAGEVVEPAAQPETFPIETDGFLPVVQPTEPQFPGTKEPKRRQRRELKVSEVTKVPEFPRAQRAPRKPRVAKAPNGTTLNERFDQLVEPHDGFAVEDGRTLQSVYKAAFTYTKAKGLKPFQVKEIDGKIWVARRA